MTSDLWKKEVAQTRRASVESVNFIIDECWQALNELNRVIEEKFDRKQAPGLTNFRKSLENVHTQVKLLLAMKREEEPDEEISDAEEAGGEGSGRTEHRAGRQPPPEPSKAGATH